MPRLTKNEYLSLLASSAALILAFISIYFQFWHVSQHLKASIIDLQLQNDSISSQIVLVNTGNQEALVTDLYAINIKESEMGKFEYSARIAPQKVIPAGLPLIIKPGEIRLIPFSTPFNINDLSHYGDLAESADGSIKDATRIKIGLHFTSMNSNGALFNKEFDICSITIVKGKLETSPSVAERKVIDILN